MTLDLLFYSVSVIFLLMLAAMWGLKGYRSWIFGVFAGFYTLLLLLLILFSLITPYAHPVELKITNYSSRKGSLYFFTEEGCQAPVRYDFPVNANEERQLEVESPEKSFSQIIFIGVDERLFSVPVPEAGSNKLDIWEKELKEGNSCYREQVQEYQWGQVRFSLIIGLSLFGLLLLFWYRWKKKSDVQ